MYNKNPQHDFTRRKTTSSSFSSSLLDSIYRSIDEVPNTRRHENDLSFYTETTMLKKQSINNLSLNHEREERSSIRKSIMIDNRMGKQSGGRRNYGSGAAAGSTVEKFFTISNSGGGRSFSRGGAADSTAANFFTTPSSSNSSTIGGGSGGYGDPCSTSSSSRSSYGGFFSSSNEYNYREKSKLSYVFSRQRSKQIRSEPPLKQPPKKKNLGEDVDGGGFSKTKQKAMKIYGELKKVSQPGSPGGRIVSFINSIFNSGSYSKKVSVTAVEDISDTDHKSKSIRSCVIEDINHTDNKLNSTRSCAIEDISHTDYKSKSNSTRSCSTRETSFSKYINGMNKSRSYPSPQEFKSSSLREIIKNRYEVKTNLTTNYNDENEDDALSCSSLDLFEIDHINGRRYREELPVFETTNIKTNQAIANGFIV